MLRVKTIRLAAAWAVFLSARLCADQVVMQNGDVLNGAVLSADTNHVILQNENLGEVMLSRAKIRRISFSSAVASAAPAEPAISTNVPEPGLAQTNSDLATMLRGLSGHTNLIAAVQSQFIGSGNPEAVKQFNDLLSGLGSGQMDINGLRQQAQSEADQLRSLKKDLGPGESVEVDGYLAILDEFLRETAPANAATNPAIAAPQTNAVATPSGTP